MRLNKTIHKLEQLLQELDNRAWNELDRFLRSPYHNREEALIHLLPYYRDGCKEAPQRVYTLMYPTYTYDHRRWLAAQRALLALAEEFVFQQTLRRHPQRTQPLRVRAYAERQLPTFAVIQAETALSTLLTSSLPRWEVAELRLQLTRAIYQSPAGARKREELSLLLHELKLHYLLLRLRYGVDVLARGITFDEPIENLTHLLPLAKKLLPTSPLLTFYYRVYQAYEQADTPDSETLLALEQLYLERYPELAEADRVFWLVKIRNLYNRATQAGIPGFRAHLFRLYRFGIDERLTLVNGRITEVGFLNLVSLGTAVGELSWIEAFRKEFLPLIAISNTQNASFISAAYLHYHRQEFVAVNDCLNELQSPSLLHQLYARPLELQSLLSRYLRDESLVGLLRKRLDTFYRWVYRDRRIAPSRKAEYQQFAKIIRLMVRLREKRTPSPQARQQAQQAIATGGGMIAREWALGIAAQL